MKRGLVNSWLRSFTVQGSWTYDRMVGLGVAFAMEPLLRDLPGGRTDPRYARALASTAAFFNAHPYLTGLAAGALAKAEHEARAPEQIDRLRTALVASLGSLGDKLIWAGWLPVCSAVGLVTAALGSPLAGVVVFLALYNVAHLALRWWGTVAGWREGFGVAGALGRRTIQVGLRLASPAAGLAIGFALPVAGAWLAADLSVATRIGVAGVAVAGVVVGRWLLPALGGTRTGMALVALAAVVALAWR